MRRIFIESSKPTTRFTLTLLISCSLLLPLLVFPQNAFPATAAADDFNRADGGLGANWTAIADGGLSISSQVVVGSSAALTGDIRTGETYAGDQYSQIEVTATQLTGSQWIGPAVRVQNGGQDTYLGIYYWNSGSPQLRLYKRTAGAWTQLGNSYNCGPLAAGTQLKVMAVGSTISFLQDGVERIAVSDSSLTGGAPGLMISYPAAADNWSGGDVTPSVYSIGGTVSGLLGTAVLQNNGGDDLSVSSNGTFAFATPLGDGAAYKVTVKSSPSDQSCTVSGGSGTVASADVTNVMVACTTTSTPPPAIDSTPPSPDAMGGSQSASAFCYGVGVDSFDWITPSRFTNLTTSPSGKPSWSYGAMPFAVKGTDPTGVMGHGYRPYCGKGTPTGMAVDNKGENVTSGYATALAYYGATVKNPNGDLGVPGWYEVVTP